MHRLELRREWSMQSSTMLRHVACIQHASCDGVYAGWVKFNSETYMCAISTGCRPQFKGEKRFLEAYILNFSGDIYGTRIKVLLVKKIRNEAVFSNIENLKKQMSKDCKEVIKILEKNKI